MLTGARRLEDPRFAEPRAPELPHAGRGVLEPRRRPRSAAWRSSSRASGPGYRLGAGVTPAHGRGGRAAALLRSSVADDVFYCDGEGEANLLRFTDVLPGDEVHVDNRKFLAYHYFARHHLMDDMQFDSLRVDGIARSTRSTRCRCSRPLMGVGYSGQYQGKLMWVHHTKDSSLWPPQGVIYRDAVLRRPGRGGRRGAVPTALDRERRARPVGDGPLAAEPGQQHLADRLHAVHRAVPGRPHRLGREEASSRSTPRSTTSTTR